MIVAARLHSRLMCRQADTDQHKVDQAYEIGVLPEAVRAERGARQFEARRSHGIGGKIWPFSLGARKGIRRSRRVMKTHVISSASGASFGFESDTAHLITEVAVVIV